MGKKKMKEKERAEIMRLESLRFVFGTQNTHSTCYMLLHSLFLAWRIA